MTRLLLPCALGILASSAAAIDDPPPTAPSDWLQWRGPDGTGMAKGSAPVEWGDDKNIKWKVEVPGRGFSTPIVVGSKIFLTTAVPTGNETAPPAGDDEGDGRRGMRPAGVGEEQDFVVLCLDRDTGEELWVESARTATPHEGYHATYGSHASASPASDGERLYVSFGSRGLYCYDLDGELVWEADLEVEMEIRRQFGEGSAPVLAGEALVQAFDHEGDSFVVALNRKTGKEIWRTDRDEPSCWAAPLPLEYDGVEQVVLSGTTRVRSYDVKTGKVIWECAGLGLNAIPMPVRYEDSVLVMTGYRDPKLMSIRLGGKGDLTGTEAVEWSTDKGLAYTASPVLHGGLLYAVMDRGFISCFDAGTGEAHYRQERLPRGSQFKASPVGAGDKLYLASESGEVHVVKMGPELEVVTTNTLEGQFFVASPVIVDGEIFLRSATHLFCVSEKKR